MSGLGEGKRLALLDLADGIEASADGCLRCAFEDDCRCLRAEFPQDDGYLLGCIYELTRITAERIRDICGEG